MGIGKKQGKLKIISLKKKFKSNTDKKQRLLLYLPLTLCQNLKTLKKESGDILKKWRFFGKFKPFDPNFG